MEDVADMADRYFDEMEARAAKRPCCDWCGKTIFAEYGYRINKDLVCEECISDCTEYLED